ncbi:MAG: hypothetical protein AB7U35_14895 [Sphingobium sp.]
MSPMLNFSRLFRSRWSALFWAAGVLFFAWQVAAGNSGGGDADKGGADPEAAALAGKF